MATTSMIGRWEPMSHPPRQSGFYAVDDGLSGHARYAAFDAKIGLWSELMATLAALDEEPLKKLSVDLSDCDAWRELTPEEVSQLTPAMITWMTKMRKK